MEPPDVTSTGTDASGIPAPGAPSNTTLDAGPHYGFFSAAEPCDATGTISIHATPLDGTVSTKAARGYVVSFDPPAVRADVALSLNALPGAGEYVGSVDHADLPGAPDCESLRADAVFAVFELGGGRLDVELAPPINDTAIDYMDRKGSCGATVDFTVAAPADRVRIFGMIPATHTLEGPVFLTEDTSGHWKGQVTDADFPHCGGGGYMFLVAAHKGAYLVGLR
jgi:hypothetical protein